MTKYICPMHPEVLEEVPGTCPDCGMALEPSTPHLPTANFRCPMHPDVMSIEPGTCTECGMALEQEVGIDQAASNPELIEMSKRLWRAVFFCVPLIVLSMGGLFSENSIQSLTGMEHALWFQCMLATPIVLWCGWPVFERGWASVRRLKLNMFTLIAIGTGTAYFFSLIALIFPDVMPTHIHAVDGTVEVYFEAAGVIITLVLLGQVLELRARDKTSAAVRDLLDLTPKFARVIHECGEEIEVTLNRLRPGDRLRVLPGEAVPVDGIIEEGMGTIDESMVSGEPLPVKRTVGDWVIGSTMNSSSTFVMRAEKVGGDTLLNQIVRMVSEAQRSRVPIQKAVDRIASYFVPFVVAIAIMTFAIWSWLGPPPALSFALINAVAVLIIACPCALGLATPMSIMVGMGRGAHAGILVRDAEAIERLEKVDVFLMDKTGTLTEGRANVFQIVPSDGWDRDKILHYAATIEKNSEHPLAQAIVDAADNILLDDAIVKDLVIESGMGICGLVGGRTTCLGNASMMSKFGIDISNFEHGSEEFQHAGITVVYVAVDTQAVGMIAISDQIRNSSASAIAGLKRLGLRIIMLTGDAPATAHMVASELGIDEVKAEVLPAQKLSVITSLQASGHKVAMVGDGINDAPSLAKADVGIAMGTGTDIAIECANFTLLHSELTGIVKARNLSSLVMKNIRQNLLFAFLYNAVGIPLAAGLLYPAFGLLLSPMFAAAAMSLSSVSVIGNALRLSRVNL